MPLGISSSLFPKLTAVCLCALQIHCTGYPSASTDRDDTSLTVQIHVCPRVLPPSM